MNGVEGIEYGNDPTGIESFIVVPTKSRETALLAALADFARAARDASDKDPNVRGLNFGLTSILRLPVGYANSTAPTTTSTVPSEPAVTPPGIEASERPGNAPKPSMEVLFSGLNSATVLTLNLTREQITRARGSVGLRLPTGYTNGATAPPESTFSAINVMNYYQTMPAGLYSNVWGIFIGITNYQEAAYNNLANAGRDAQELSQAFVDTCGLREPILLLDGNASHSGLEDAFRKIGERDGPGDLFVFHFSGHGYGVAEKETGYMLLHDAPLPQGFDSGRGVIEMNLLQRMAESAGIEAKHQLYLLDCCYSGMAMASRTRSRGFDPAVTSARESNIRDMLAMRAVYVISAGRRGQPVLDGPAGADGGHGLLSGFVLEALREPARFNLGKEVLEGVELVSTRQLFAEADQRIRSQAREVWQTELRKVEQSRSRGTSTRRPACRDAGSSPLDRLSTASDLAKLTQGPQDGRFETEAWVYLPLRKAGAAGAPGHEAVVQEGNAWCDTVSRQYTSDYARRLEKVFSVLGKGQPPRSSRSGLVEVEAELLRRPRIDDATQNEIVPLTYIDRYYPQARTNEQLRLDLQALELERWRSRNRGTQWEPLRHRGDALSSHYELRMQVVNRGSNPVYYYLIQLDQAGVLQWLAPANNSWHDEEYGEKRGRFTHGPMQLTASNSSLFLPPNLRVGGSTVTQGWPIDDNLDLQFYLVVTGARWTELESVLNEASSMAWELFEGDHKREKRMIETRLPEVFPGVRAVRPVTHKIAPTPSDTRQSPNSGPPLVYRTEQGLLMLSWTTDVRSASELVPQLELSSTR